MLKRQHTFFTPEQQQQWEELNDRLEKNKKLLVKAREYYNDALEEVKKYNPEMQEKNLKPAEMDDSIKIQLAWFKQLEADLFKQEKEVTELEYKINAYLQEQQSNKNV